MTALRWRDDIVTGVALPSGWATVRGDVLEAGEYDCISLRQVSTDHGHGYRLTHMATGCSIVTLPDQPSAREVAEQIVRDAHPETWTTEVPVMAAERLRDVLVPILAGRRCFFAGRWRAGR